MTLDCQRFRICWHSSRLVTWQCLRRKCMSNTPTEPSQSLRRPHQLSSGWSQIVHHNNVEPVNEGLIQSVGAEPSKTGVWRKGAKQSRTGVIASTASAIIIKSKTDSPHTYRRCKGSHHTFLHQETDSKPAATTSEGCVLLTNLPQTTTILGTAVFVAVNRLIAEDANTHQLRKIDNRGGRENVSKMRLRVHFALQPCGVNEATNHNSRRFYIVVKYILGLYNT